MGMGSGYQSTKVRRTNAVADELFSGWLFTGVYNFHKDHIGFSNASHMRRTFAVQKVRSGK